MQRPLSPRNVCGRLSASLLFIMFAVADEAAADWDPAVFNPQRAADDVVLPMPCDGSMVFRRVETEWSGVGSDQLVRLGNTAIDEKVALEGAMELAVSGAFGQGSKTRYYLLGKYEVTRQQYQSMMSDACPGELQDRDLPMARLSWFDAVDLAHRYSLWLLKHAKDKLPSEGRLVGYVRLPTEAEWEFAARGGLMLSGSAADFQATIPPMRDQESLNDYVWYNDPKSASDGAPRPIGLKKPNPLGLYDMLGNVDELVLEPFHLRLPSRRHGQTGAYVIRGGSSHTPLGDIRTSWRQEVPYYLNGDTRHNPSTGVRLVVASPVWDKEKSKSIAAEWEGTQAASPRAASQKMPPRSEDQDLPATPPNPHASTQEFDDPRVPALERNLATMTVQLEQCRRDHPNAMVACPRSVSNLGAASLADPRDDLRDLAEHADDLNLKLRLNSLRVTLAAAIESRDEQLAQAAREALRAAGLLCLGAKSDHYQVTLRIPRDEKDFRCGTPQAFPKRCAEIEAEKRNHPDIIASNVRVYAGTIIKLGQTYEASLLEQQHAFLANDLQRRSVTDFLLSVRLAYRQVAQFRHDGKALQEQWYRECKDIEVH